MVRNVIAVLIGIVVAFLVIMGIQMINFSLYPFPEGLDQNDSEAMKEYAESLPSLAYIIVLLSYFFGTLIASFVAVKIAQTHHKVIALIIGGFLLVMAIINMFRISHPIWFVILCLLIFIPTALLGHKLATRSNNP